ncbi:hypothetical protein LCGC14_2516480 [marine sediment metagenome]|uniref:Uncharacterized protein n=1 Tax=marine sediment metagenome TaxID=412755 RepID=A0A0F9D990_9ZZZZ
MSKFTDAIKTTLKSYFEKGDQPSAAQFAAWIDAIQEGIEEHQHLGTGGAGSGTGDAASLMPVVDGATTVGYARSIAANDVGATAKTIIADGTGDVTAILVALVVVEASDGNTDAGFVYVRNNDSTVIYSDGTDECTLAVSAAGAATLQRTAGSTLTFDVILGNATWI